MSTIDAAVKAEQRNAVLSSTVRTFVKHGQSDAAVAELSHAAYEAVEAGVKLSQLAELIEIGLRKAGKHGALYTTGRISQYGAAWRTLLKAGISPEDNRELLSASLLANSGRMKAGERDALIETVAALPEGERVDALAAGLVTAKAPAAPKAPAYKPSDDDTSEAAGRAVNQTVTATVHAIRSMAHRVENGELSETEISELVSAWESFASKVSASTSSVSRALASIA